MSDELQPDILIVGGGLVGATLAACLARDPALRICMVEKFPPPPQAAPFHPSYDARNTALSNGTCHIFDQLGLWQALREHAQPIQRIQVSQQGGFGGASISAGQERVRALGYVIENRWIGKVLYQYLQRCPQVDFRAPAEVAGLRYVGNRMQARLDDGQLVQTPLLVIADGAQSATRHMLGIGVQVKDYGQAAIVTAVTPDKPHGNRALERFTPHGPLALLPQTDNRLGLAWCQSPAQAQHLMAASDAEFLRALEQAAGDEVGRLVTVGKRFSYPLSLTLAEEQVRPNAVVLGNAAHALHPVAGQGLNMALRDVAVLVQTLVEARQQGQDWSEFGLLQRYLARRERDQFNTLQFSDKLVRLFGQSGTGLSLLRGAGLILFDSVPGAKRLLARHAMGRSQSTRLPEVS